MLEIPAALLAAFPPSADLLLNRARLQIDDAMLWEIAVADYGNMADECMSELLSIRDNGFLPAGFLRSGEVLTLMHYFDPDLPGGNLLHPGRDGQRGHQTRLFVSVVLLRGEAEWPDHGFDQVRDSSLAQCLISAKALGEEMGKAAACFLTWRIPQPESTSDALLRALGLLVLAIRLRSGRFDVPTLGTIVDWVFAIDSLERQENAPYENPWRDPWRDLSGFWRPLADELRAEAEAIRDDDVRTNIQLCALLLETD
jgi:hypothetical protein